MGWIVYFLQSLQYLQSLFYNGEIFLYSRLNFWVFWIKNLTSTTNPLFKENSYLHFKLAFWYVFPGLVAKTFNSKRAISASKLTAYTKNIFLNIFFKLKKFSVLEWKKWMKISSFFEYIQATVLPSFPWNDEIISDYERKNKLLFPYNVPLNSFINKQKN